VFLDYLVSRKSATEAVYISILINKQLKVTVKIKKIHLIYYNINIRPGFKKYNVIYIKEIDDKSKSKLLNGAIALVFSI
jgi:uncharacterized membrane protein